MADKTIGELPSVASVQDNSLIPVEQSSVASKMTGAQFRAWAESGGAAAAQPYAAQAAASASAAAASATNAASSKNAAASSASDANTSKNAAAASATAAANSATQAGTQATNARNSALDADEAKEAIENLGVTSSTLPPGSSATVEKSVSQQGAVTLAFGIPRGDKGDQGATGPQGPQGIQGPQGERGIDGVAVAADGVYAFNVNDEGHLILYYTGEDAPDFEINSNGHLILTI